MPVPDQFVYIAPNDDTLPRHNRIRRAQSEVGAGLKVAVFPEDHAHQLTTVESFGLINDACKHFAAEISAVCPPSADRSAAERCVRLARMLANEAVILPLFEQKLTTLELAQDQLMLARMQACASVALALPAELPPLS